MQLERLAIVLRPRHANEAIDLGIRMAMHWFKPLYSAWLCFAIPVLGLLFGLAYWLEFSYFTLYLLIWWIQPLLDRMALFVISRAVFGDAPTIRQSMRAIPTLLIKTRLFRALTWARLTPYRSLTLPVDVLEGVPRKSAKIRRSAISNYIGVNAIVLTLYGFIIEQIFPLCAMAFMAMLSIDSNGFSEDLIDMLIFNEISYLSLVTLGLFALGILLWEPIYVAAGFSLYLKRRSDIEAWDIELQFRKTEQNKNKTSSALFAALLAVLVGFSGYTTEAYAAENAQRQQAIEQSTEALNELLKQPEYGGKKTQKRLKFFDDKKTKRNPKKATETPIDMSKTPLSNGIAGVEQGFLWFVLAITIAIIVYLIIVRLPIMRAQRKTSDRPPTQIAGLDIQPESLPENIADVARNLIRAGDLRAALSLLFRGALSVLAHRDRVMFRSSDTEQDCIRQVKRSGLTSAAFFIRLTQLWLAQAYAHRSPDIAQLEQICVEWPSHFDHQSQWEAS